MFEISFDASKPRLYAKIQGFWDEAVFARFVRELAETSKNFPADATTTLIDATEATVQSVAVMEKMREFVHDNESTLPRRTAVVVSSVLVKLQFDRTAPTRIDAKQAFFDSRAAAEKWLDEGA